MQFVLTKPSSIGSGSHYRDVRKVYLSPEILKANRLCTGDVVAITGDNTTVSCRSRITNANMIQPSLNRIMLLVSFGLPLHYPRNVSNRGFVKLHTHLMCRIQSNHGINIPPTDCMHQIRSKYSGFSSLWKCYEKMSSRDPLVASSSGSYDYPAQRDINEWPTFPAYSYRV